MRSVKVKMWTDRTSVMRYAYFWGIYPRRRLADQLRCGSHLSVLFNVLRDRNIPAGHHPTSSKWTR